MTTFKAKMAAAEAEVNFKYAKCRYNFTFEALLII